MNGHAIIILALSLASCGKADDRAEPDPATDRIAELHASASARLLKDFVQGDTWVVSRWDDSGAAERQGEGLLWSGVALSALTCEDGNGIEAGLIAAITAHGGALVRIEPLGEYEGGREVTWDGAVGLYRGIAARATFCPGSAERWAPVIALHVDYVDANGGQLNARAPATIPEPLRYVLDLLAWRLGVGNEPNHGRLAALELAFAVQAAGVNATHAAAYRLNLALLSFQTVENLGISVSGGGRDRFCAASRGVDIPTMDEWCGRGGLASWIDGFQFNAWEFRHQRAGAWERPDGAPGLSTPGLDILVAIVQAYALNLSMETDPNGP